MNWMFREMCIYILVVCVVVEASLMWSIYSLIKGDGKDEQSNDGLNH